MLLNDLFYIISANAAVEGSLGVNNNDGTQCAKTEATGLNKLYLVSETESLDVLGESLLQGKAARRGTTCTATNKNM
jgi:hypothetical protein